MDSRRERRINLGIAICTLVALPLVAFAMAKVFVPAMVDAAIGGDGVDCDEFEFDGSAWNGSGREQRYMAEGLAECDSFEGYSRADVSHLLGRDYREGRVRPRWIYPPGLDFHFGPDGRVEDTRLIENADALAGSGYGGD